MIKEIPTKVGQHYDFVRFADLFGDWIPASAGMTV